LLPYLRPVDFFRELLLDFLEADFRPLERDVALFDEDFFELDLRPLDFFVAIACLP
jgi:hypothetical protein